MIEPLFMQQLVTAARRARVARTDARDEYAAQSRARMADEDRYLAVSMTDRSYGEVDRSILPTKLEARKHAKPPRGL
jgi:hypothetical protein